MFASVRADEMAFGMALFVGAGNRELPTTNGGMDEPRRHRVQNCRTMFLALSSETLIIPAREQPSPGVGSLFGAFLAVWEQFEGDVCQASVCARVLGFHYLMERSGGAVLRRWLYACPESDGFVILHPAVIECIAATILSKRGILSESAFVAEIERAAGGGSGAGEDEATGQRVGGELSIPTRDWAIDELSDK